MDRDFEPFLGGPNEAASKRVHITLSPANLLLMNRNLYTLMGKPDAVRFGYSRKRDIISIEPSSPRLNNSFPVIPSGKSFRINVAPFCRHFNIRFDTTRKFLDPELVGRTLHIKPNQTISVSRQRRKRK
jgi:hypothetical protein